jgi:hypothetical protein
MSRINPKHWVTMVIAFIIFAVVFFSLEGNDSYTALVIGVCIYLLWIKWYLKSVELSIEEEEELIGILSLRFDNMTQLGQVFLNFLESLRPRKRAKALEFFFENVGLIETGSQRILLQGLDREDYERLHAEIKSDLESMGSPLFMSYHKMLRMMGGWSLYKKTAFLSHVAAVMAEQNVRRRGGVIVVFEEGESKN